MLPGGLSLMSAINETLKYLIANRARLTAVDRAYLAFVESNNGFSQQEVLRLSIIYAQLTLHHGARICLQ